MLFYLCSKRNDGTFPPRVEERVPCSRSSEHGTCKTVKSRFWPWLSGKRRYTLSSGSIHTTPHTPHPTPHTLHPSPYTLHPTPYTLHSTLSRKRDLREPHARQSECGRRASRQEERSISLCGHSLLPAGSVHTPRPHFGAGAATFAGWCPD